MIVDALRLSALVALASTALVSALGTAAGWLLARHRFPGREGLDALLMAPLVLPPTVTGYGLLVLLGRDGPLGGLGVPFTLAACIAASSVLAFPLMLRAARTAFEEVDPRLELAAATLGHGRASTFLRVSLPLARRGLWAGVMLAFARGLGEFGATLMLAGNIPGRTQTLPLAVYEAVASGEDRAALLLSILLTGLSVGVMLAAGRLGRRR